MCGVIGLVYERDRDDLGAIAAELLRTLEYRGYDSTGAAVQASGEAVRLVKGVGAPSVMVHELGIVSMKGRAFCGQVRWATFGAVTDENSQPHLVRCKAHLYGAHNGNVTNCDDLKTWLEGEGHAVLSDNDGEMVVHAVEHFFARELARVSAGDRAGCMRRAIARAAARLEGSYAAVLVDPATTTMWAIKQGSSLYFGIGSDSGGGSFSIASSDLSSVLALTRIVVPVSDGELVEYGPDHHRVWSVATGEPLDREPVRSRLRAKDTELVPPFETFMDQEIHAQRKTAEDVVTLFLGGSEAARSLAGIEGLEPLRARWAELGRERNDEALRAGFRGMTGEPAFAAALARVPDAIRRAHELRSSDAGLLSDLVGPAHEEREMLAVRLLDAMLEAEEAREYARALGELGKMCLEAAERRGRIYAVCCGSSFNAAKVGSLFFSEIAGLELLPMLPGEFRGQSARSLADGDIVLAVSQSGETKDLIDVLNDVAASGRSVRRVALVNNVSSTLAQEKSDLVIPLRCGPEVAVPATKSFMNQMVVLYCLALHVAERLGADVAARRDKLRSLPALVEETFDATDADLEVAAELLHLRPSIHILATRLSGVAREAALKVREVVLNHTEGFEASEFKHGPNTILGVNTVHGPLEVGAMLVRLGRALQELARGAARAGLGPASVERLVEAATDSVLSPARAPFSLDDREREVFERAFDRGAILDELYADYPLVYVTGPEDRDVALTVSQINTHKIRGACTVVVAEDHPALRGAATKAPADNPEYRSVYVTLPRTNDTLMVAFSATVALQRLALKMSLRKKHWLDRLGVRDHGVHPDVPKNVSKSITVD